MSHGRTVKKRRQARKQAGAAKMASFIERSQPREIERPALPQREPPR
jgi:hypothetical protein